MATIVVTLLNRGITIAGEKALATYTVRTYTFLARALKVGAVIGTWTALETVFAYAKMSKVDVEGMSLQGCSFLLDPNEQGLCKYEQLKEALERAAGQLEGLHREVKRGKWALNVSIPIAGTLTNFFIHEYMLSEIESHEKAITEIVMGTFQQSGGNPYSTKKRRKQKRS
jgi:hypothetical protein